MSLEHLKKNREGRIAGLLLNQSHYDGVLQLISVSVAGWGVASRQSKSKTGEETRTFSSNPFLEPLPNT